MKQDMHVLALQHLCSILKLLLLALWHEVIQPAQLSLGKETVH